MFLYPLPLISSIFTGTTRENTTNHNGSHCADGTPHHRFSYLADEPERYYLDKLCLYIRRFHYACICNNLSLAPSPASLNGQSHGTTVSPQYCRFEYCTGTDPLSPTLRIPLLSPAHASGARELDKHAWASPGTASHHAAPQRSWFFASNALSASTSSSRLASSRLSRAFSCSSSMRRSASLTDIPP
jgi:hypothetical protein